MLACCYSWQPADPAGKRAHQHAGEGKGTPLADNEDVDAFDFIRTIAVARIMMPTSYVRLSAGREQMSEQTQAMCFMAGANSIFYGCKLLTTPNPEEDKDVQLFRKLG